MQDIRKNPQILITHYVLMTGHILQVHPHFPNNLHAFFSNNQTISNAIQYLATTFKSYVN